MTFIVRRENLLFGPQKSEVLLLKKIVKNLNL